MNMQSVRNLLAVLSIGTLLLIGPPLRAQESGADQKARSENPQKGIEVQTRGPVHEAFAQPIVRGAGDLPHIKKKPPEPIDELPPDQKPEGERVVWIPGYWAWDDDRDDFLWVSGLWRNAPPNRQWVPGYWNQVDDEYEWVPGHWGVENQNDVEVLPAAPPDPVDESPSPAPDDDSSYVPGCWVYNNDRYMWRPGFWHRYRPGWIWNSASYYPTPAGYVFVDGYWDYDYQNRGLLFAPVYFDQGLLGQSGWNYRPAYVVATDFLLAALFARVANHSYYYGDYFDPRYGRAGYLSWLDYRIGTRFYDPAYGYYRWTNRNNSRWDTALRAQYRGRRDGSVARPPRTLAEQSKSSTGMRAVTPLAQVKAVKLQPVSKKELQDVHVKHASQMRTLSQQRAKSETRLRQQGAQTGRSSTAPSKHELSRPKAAEKPLRAAPPPTPVHPKPEARPVPKAQPRPQAQPRVTPKPEPRPTPAPRPAPPPAKPAPKPAPKPAKDKPEKH
jgi:hypothetical protein